MAALEAFRPRRSLVFPFFVALFPMLWFVFRETPRRVVDGQLVATPVSRTLGLATVAVVASYGLAVIVVTALGPRLAPSWRRVLLQPTTGALLALGGLCSALVAYAVLHSAMTLPVWSELVLGVTLLWPLLVAMLVTITVGNAVPALQSFGFQAGFAVVGLGLSAAWMFLLATGIARVLFRPE